MELRRSYLNPGNESRFLVTIVTSKTSNSIIYAKLGYYSMIRSGRDLGIYKPQENALLEALCSVGLQSI